MRRTRMIVGALLLVLATLVFQGGVASAASPASYQGQFNGAITYVGCQTTPEPAAATGTWTVTVHGTSAKATFDILVNGAPHVAYTFPGMKQATVDGTVFAAYGRTQAGLLTVTLYPSGQFTYVIAPYSYQGLTCTSVTFPGQLD